MCVWGGLLRGGEIHNLTEIIQVEIGMQLERFWKDTKNGVAERPNFWSWTHLLGISRPAAQGCVALGKSPGAFATSVSFSGNCTDNSRPAGLPLGLEVMPGEQPAHTRTPGDPPFLPSALAMLPLFYSFSFNICPPNSNSFMLQSTEK